MAEFETLFKVHQGPVVRFVKFRISSRQDAEKILQEIYLTALQEFHTLGEEKQFKAWLLAIARNKCKAFQRGQREHVQQEAGTFRWGPLAPVPGGLGQEQLKQLHDIYGYNRTEIGNLLAGSNQIQHGFQNSVEPFSISTRLYM